MPALPASDLLALPPQALLTFVMLRRRMHAHDAWSGIEDTRVAAALIFATSEFIEKNVAFGERHDIYDIFDLAVEYDAALLERIYSVLLGKPPDDPSNADAVETGDLATRELSLADLCGKICWSEEFLSSIRSGSKPIMVVDDHKTDLTRLAKFFLQDRYNNALRRRLDGTDRVATKRDVLDAPDLEIQIVLFNDLAEDLADLQERIDHVLPGKSVRIVLRTEQEVAASGFSSDPILFLTNNNFLYARPDATFSHLAATPNVLSVCWLFDNHHQFGLSTTAAEQFDIVFPAHCNGTEYLHGHKAIVGPVVPCATIQWSRQAASQHYKEAGAIERSDTLYGRFSSYEGRVAARDRFLHAAAATSFGSEIKSLKAPQQDWYHRTPLQRFEDFARHKVALSTPIFNDIPIRIFDSLLAGQIPIVPYGSLGLETALSFEDQHELPVVTYLPNDLRSLEAAYRHALLLYDRDGQSGADRRHRAALDRHMLVHRVETMVRQTFRLASM